jgi:Flp pilus assembly protein TadB
MFSIILIMNKLKKLSLISILITFIMSVLSILTLKIVTLNGFFIFGGITSFALALFYVYLNRARQTFKKDLLDNLK